MTDLGELKQRVDHAVEELAAAQNVRRNQHDSLVQLLADLEVKFDARHEELVYCHSRIADLEKANDQLGDLLNTVVQLIESGSVQDPDDPIFRASKMAADLVSLCAQSPAESLAGASNRDAGPQMVTVQAEVIEDRPPVAPPEPIAPAPAAMAAPPPAVDPSPAPTPDVASPPAPPPQSVAPAPPPAEPEIEVIEVETSLPAPEPLPAEPAAADSVIAPPAPVERGTYEDVSQEELDVELLLGDDLDDPSLPQALQLAAKAAKMDSGDMANRLAEVSAAVDAARRGEEAPAAQPDDVLELDIPGIETVVEFDIAEGAEHAAPAPSLDDPAAESDTDIKALMARIQEAAEKARQRSDTRNTDEPIWSDPPTPGKTGTS